MKEEREEKEKRERGGERGRENYLPKVPSFAISVDEFFHGNAFNGFWYSWHS